MDISFIPILLSFIFCIVFSIYYLPSLFKSTRDESQSPETPPGRTGLPFIGETLDFLSSGRKGIPERFVLDRITKYSSMVFKTSLFGETMALLCGPEGNKFIFSNHNKLVRTWFPHSVGKLFYGDKNLSLVDVTAGIRKLYSPYFALDALKKYVPIMDSGTRQHLQIHWEGRDVVTVHELTKLYTITIACRLFLGIEDQETVERLHKPFAQFMLGVFSIPVNIPGTNFNRAFKAKAQLMKELDEWIKKWKSDFLDGRLSATQSSLANIVKQAFEEDDFSSALLGLLGAAYDSSSSTLACIMMFLGKHPQVYNNVLSEQREIAKSKAQGEMLNWGDIQNMKYSWNVVCETLRIHSTVGGFREVISDFTYEGYLIPKGWKVHCSLFATHNNPKYFKDSDKFDPSRFEGEGPIPYSFVPFGGGPRMCMGKEYVRIKILTFMHHLVTKFRWEQIFPHEKIITEPVSKPAKGLPVRLYPHES